MASSRKGGVGADSRPAPTGRWGEWAPDLLRPLATKEPEDCNLPSLAVAFKQRHSEALGGPTPGPRSRDAIGQSSA